MTTTEEVIRLAREVADASLNDPVVGSSIVLDIGEMKRLIELVKAEENEACAKVYESKTHTLTNGVTCRKSPSSVPLLIVPKPSERG